MRKLTSSLAAILFVSAHLSPAAADVSQCNWNTAVVFPTMTLADMAVNPDGRVFVTGTRLTPGGETQLVTYASDDQGSNWAQVDVVISQEGDSTGAHDLVTAGDGNIYVLGWASRSGSPEAFVRRSLQGGEPGTWEDAEQSWPFAQLGAITADVEGRVYVALGFAGPSGLGWTVESALAGIGAWTVEDTWRPSFSGVSTVEPHDLTTGPDGSLWVTGQLNGAADHWITRRRLPVEKGGHWLTEDLFRFPRGSYVLAGASVMPDSLVAGYGVRNGRDDYEWLHRLPTAKGWITETFQLEPGRHSLALDSASDGSGRQLVVGTALTADGGWHLVVRSTSDQGQTWDLTAIPGVTSQWSARIAVGAAGDLYLAGELGGRPTVLRCWQS